MTDWIGKLISLAEKIFNIKTVMENVRESAEHLIMGVERRIEQVQRKILLNLTIWILLLISTVLVATGTIMLLIEFIPVPYVLIGAGAAGFAILLAINPRIR